MFSTHVEALCTGKIADDDAMVLDRHDIHRCWLSSIICHRDVFHVAQFAFAANKPPLPSRGCRATPRDAAPRNGKTRPGNRRSSHAA